MEEPPQTKGMKPVTGVVMLNFISWLTTYHHEVESLRNLPRENLSRLVHDFESSRPDIEPSAQREWLKGFEQLFIGRSSQDDYADTREALKRMK